MPVIALIFFLQSSAPLADQFAEIAKTSGQDMADSTTGPQRIKGWLPPKTAVAHKTGTGGTHEGKTSATNDMGIITLPDGRHVAIAVFLKDSTADLVRREATIAKGVRAAWDLWTAAK